VGEHISRTTVRPTMRAHNGVTIWILGPLPLKVAELSTPKCASWCVTPNFGGSRSNGIAIYMGPQNEGTTAIVPHPMKLAVNPVVMDSMTTFASPSLVIMQIRSLYRHV